MDRSRGAQEDPDPCPFQDCHRLAADMTRYDAIDVFPGHEIPGSRPAGDSMHAGGVLLRRVRARVQVIKLVVTAAAEAGVNQVLKFRSRR
jgi:hypothetical protein